MYDLVVSITITSFIIKTSIIVMKLPTRSYADSHIMKVVGSNKPRSMQRATTDSQGRRSTDKRIICQARQKIVQIRYIYLNLRDLPASTPTEELTLRQDSLAHQV